MRQPFGGYPLSAIRERRRDVYGVAPPLDGIRVFWNDKRVLDMAATLQPDLESIWGQLTGRQLETKAKLHVPLLRRLLDELGMRARARAYPRAERFPMIGKPAEPEVYPGSAGRHSPDVPRRSIESFSATISVQRRHVSPPRRPTFGGS